MIRKCTRCGVLLPVVLIALAGTLTAAEKAGFDAAHRVTFRSGATAVDKLNFNAPHDQIAGYLYKPAGEGPFAAVVLVPDRDGLHPIHKAWAERLAQWGYVALAVDIYARPTPKSSGVVDAHDAYGALKYLADLPYVQTRRIAWIGWSLHGGDAIVQSGGLEAQPHEASMPTEWFVSGGPLRFQAAVAFYPQCPGVKKTYYAPVLILMSGNKPERVAQCKASAAQSMAGSEPIRLHVYPEATERFDMPGANRDPFGAPAHYDPAAAADAIAQVKAFLAEQLLGQMPAQ